MVIFAVILIASELLGHYAMVWMPGAAYFTFSLIVPITALVLVRWGWWAVFYPVIGGVTYCLVNGLGLSYYATHVIGGEFILLLLLPIKFFKVDNIRKRWYFTAIFAIVAWVAVYLGRSTLWAVTFAISPVEGQFAYSGFLAFGLDVMSLFMSVAVLLVMRKLDGMFEDQKSYLKRVDKERRDRMRYDNFGDQPVEIDEEALSILSRDNDLYDK